MRRRSHLAPPRSAPTIVQANPEAIAELGQLRRRELTVLSDRLGRIEEPGRKRWWGGAAVTLFSVGLGALLAGIPLLNSRSDWDKWVLPVYWGGVAAACVLAAVCGLAYRSIQAERADSVKAIKEDLDSLLAGYDQAEASTALADLLPHFLSRMRAEVRDNMRLLRQAKVDGRYWKVTETGPSTDEWKRNSMLLEGERDLEDVYEQGRQAAAEVERLWTARSLRFFRGSYVRRDDRLDEAIELLARFERALTDAMASLESSAGAMPTA